MLVFARWLAILTLVVLSSPALAQSCGPDAAPPQAAAQGFNCETFRWGSGDTIAEIDTGMTYAAPCATPWISPCSGFKLYYNTSNQGGYNPITSGQVTVDGSGKIHTDITGNPHCSGCFVIQTCGGPDLGGGVNSPWTVGTFFQHGHYIEVVMEWAAPNTSNQTGFYGYDGFWYNDFAHGNTVCPGTVSNACYEVDNPDAFAFEQLVAPHAGGNTFPQQENPNPFAIQPTITETGTNKWGFLSTSTISRFYAGNNVLQGDINYLSIGNPTELYNSKQCYGSEATLTFPLIIDSIKVWQAGPTAPRGGAGRRLRH